MRASVLTGIKKIAMTELPDPEPRVGEVLVRVTHVGLCGSDVHYWRDGRIGDAVVEFPYVVGHEVSGRIEALGPGVAETALPVGRAVAIEPGVPCWACAACQRGLPHCCPHVTFFGTPPVPGTFCELIKTVPRNLLPVPEGVTLEAAAVIEPLGVAVHAANISSLRPGMQVGIFGAGPIGLLMLQVVRAGGGTPVFVTELIPERIAAAQAMGGDMVIDPLADDAGAKITAATGGLDLAFEAAGAPEAVNDAIRALRPGGHLVVIGIPTAGATAIDFHTARRKELRVVFSRRSNYEGHQCLRLLASRGVTTEGIVTHRFPLEELSEAFHLASGYRDGVIKAMIEVNSAHRP